MPSVSGRNLISEITEKAGRRLIVVSSIAILVKLYEVNLEDLSVLGLNLPPELFDLVALCLIIYMIYVLVVNWLGDLAAFRLWYTESDIWSEFGSNMKLDRDFISGGTKLLQKLFALEKSREWPNNFEDLPEEVKSEFNEYKINSELFVARLGGAGKKFSVLSGFALFYIWFQEFFLPMIFASIGLYLLFTCGSFLPPSVNDGI